MRALLTKYRGPTNTGGSRILVYDEGRCVMRFPYDHSLSHEGPHREAVRAYCKKMNWVGTMECGGTRDGYAFVWRDNTSAFEVTP